MHYHYAHYDPAALMAQNTCSWDKVQIWRLLPKREFGTQTHPNGGDWDTTPQIFENFKKFLISTKQVTNTLQTSPL